VKKTTWTILTLLITVCIERAVAEGEIITGVRDSSHPRTLSVEASDDWKALVANTHADSLAAREQILRDTISRNTTWPNGAWGETLWSLAALYLNERVDEANASLLKRANEYIALHRAGIEISTFAPEGATETPWAYFAITDYVRILGLFRAKSAHVPGRLTPEAEAAMKESLWFWVKSESEVAGASLEHLLVTLGTENHDLTRRPNYYLISSILKDDPAYRDRLYDDGHTAAEHATAYTAFFREWPRKRAATGLWIELGSNTYQKYSWPALFNLHDLAPDPVVRKRSGLLLDLALIEEAQISVRGRRGGGRSRAEGGVNGFEVYKDLLYAGSAGWVSDPTPSGRAAPRSLRGSSHSKVIETSHYPAPAAAILLRKRTFPVADPFEIRNRVLGEQAPSRPEDGEGNRYLADSALVNYAYRTPHYLMGSTLQNPALTMPHPDPTSEKPEWKYGGISRQQRWCGVLFDDPTSREVGAVYPVVEQTRGGRSQHAWWSVQEQNVILIQRIAPQTRTRMGSYSAGAIGVRFDGTGLEMMEEGGWIFTSTGKAFVAVKFLDADYAWNEGRTEATPPNLDHQSDTSRILMHAGDVAHHASFAQFRRQVRACPLTVTPDHVAYAFGPAATRLAVTRFDVDQLEDYSSATINDKPIDLRPEATWQSPYLNGAFSRDQVMVTVGPIQRLLDFSESAETRE
jgi:hypothetical protein